MKTTLMFRQIANPRRTTLAHLTDASELTAPRADAAADEANPVTADPKTDAKAAAPARQLPQRTANPRRTVLTELPTSPAAP
ncbi:hypothetical protein [Streptomyces sp. NBC_01190]|uniref:hypothetical protein n=1 Tax=Streptomyces sp. NBC_01190 TaxID=2903767 RepID=UPI003870C0AE|nr:hypothetical protein OG519_25595 [Streptomyces sp. NBC_01190]